MKMKALASALVAVTLALGITGVTQAADPHFVVKVGLADVEPKADNGTGLLNSANLDADVGSSVRPSITFEYLITPNIGVELLAAWPFENKVYLGDTKVGSVNVLPPTLSLQYHFLPDNLVSPFIGAGINYTLVYNSSVLGGAASVDNSWGFAAHAGIDLNFTKNWLATFDVRWIQMRNDVNVTGLGKVGKVEIDPWVWGVSVGYRF